MILTLNKRNKMKIQKIKITSFRGIPDEFECILKCNSLVVTGDNGTGKSGIIDAVDFLLTGKIKRLSGEGTKDISQESYGHHIDKKKKDTKIEAEIKFNNQHLTIQRFLAQPKKLHRITGNTGVFNDLKNFLEVGQFSLSRRELLKFIICTDQDRSKAIQELLDISEIEKVRKVINQAYKKLKTKYEGLESTIQDKNQNIKNALGLECSAQINEIRKKINKYREKLKSKKITQWEQDTDILSGVSLQKVSSNISLNKNNFEEMLKFLDQNNESVKADKNLLIQIIKDIRNIKSFEELTKTNDLVELGMKLLTDNTCPLCDINWREKNLLDYLKSKLEKAKNAIQLKKEFQNTTQKIKSYLTDYLSGLEKLLQNIQILQSENLKKELNSAITFVTDYIKLYDDISKKEELIKKIEKEQLPVIDLPNWIHLKKEIDLCLKKMPEENPEDKIYQALISVKNAKKDIQKYQADLRKNNIGLVKKIQNLFERNMESFFKKLYEDIKNDFISYYKYLNADELNFSANMKQQEGSVNLKVDFYNRGEHPPHALHSEGHQDSMGICLFLALMKKIKGDSFSIALLDDVMMSVDIGHRRRLAQLLKKKFPNTQFLITTHDPIWAKELKKLNIVDTSNMLEFRNWSPEGGPEYQIDDPWIKCEEYAKKGKIKESSGLLRSALEEEFQDIAEYLSAKVPFKKDSRWTFGELLDSSLCAFQKALKKAITVADTTNNNENLTKIKEIKERINIAKQEADVDIWILNPMIHYNEWAKFSKDEMITLINNMKALCTAFCFDNDEKEHFIISDHRHNEIALTTTSGKVRFPLKED